MATGFDFGDLFDEVSVSSIYFLFFCSQSLVSVRFTLRRFRGRPPERPRIDSSPRFTRPYISLRTFRESIRHTVKPGNQDRAEFTLPSSLRSRSAELFTSSRFPRQ